LHVIDPATVAALDAPAGLLGRAAPHSTTDALLAGAET